MALPLKAAELGQTDAYLESIAEQRERIRRELPEGHVRFWLGYEGPKPSQTRGIKK